MEHREFLDTSGDRPMRACMTSLVAALDSNGPVFAYTSFEERVLHAEAVRHTHLAPALKAIADRLVDLHAVSKTHYYHPAQTGSWSIKAGLPTIAPDLDYANLGEVSDGGGAQVAYLEMVHPDTTAERRTILAKALLTYCRRDTEAMVRIARHLSMTNAVKEAH